MKSDKPKQNTPAESAAPYQLFNIGNSKPVDLMDFKQTLETSAGQPVDKQYMDMQPGDVSVTYADTARLKNATGYQPSTPIQQGVDQFIAWYRSFYA